MKQNLEIDAQVLKIIVPEEGKGLTAVAHLAFESYTIRGGHLTIPVNRENERAPWKDNLGNEWAEGDRAHFKTADIT